MKILSETEIRSLNDGLCKSLKTFLLTMLKKYEDAAIAYNAESEKQYQNAMELYNTKMQQYEELLKQYEKNVAQEELDFPKRMAEWERKEEEHKANLERNYQNALASYEMNKRMTEAAGQVYRSQKPQRTPYFQVWSKPTKRVFNKPVPPTKPTIRSVLNPEQIDVSHPTVGWHRIGPFQYTDELADLCASGLNPRTLPSMHLIQKLGYLSKDNVDKAVELLRKELYLNHREAMEDARNAHYAMHLTSTERGLYGEKWAVIELELCILDGLKGIILHNLEFEVGNRTNQIDILFITIKGIFVIESKNYDGDVSGTEAMPQWRLRTRRKEYHFNNPIQQNQAHIRLLSQHLPATRYFSLILFSESSQLEYIDIHQPDTFVLNRHALKDVIKDTFWEEPNIMTEQDVELAASTLRRFCADDPKANPNYKETKSYYSSRSKADASRRSSSNDPQAQAEEMLENMFRFMDGMKDFYK